MQNTKVLILGANGQIARYRTAADILEASKLDYTMIRPAWLTDYDEVNYEITEKGESFK